MYHWLFERWDCGWVEDDDVDNLDGKTVDKKNITINHKGGGGGGSSGNNEHIDALHLTPHWQHGVGSSSILPGGRSVDAPGNTGWRCPKRKSEGDLLASNGGRKA